MCGGEGVNPFRHKRIKRKTNGKTTLVLIKTQSFIMHGDTEHNSAFVIVVLHTRSHRRHIFVALLTYNKLFLCAKYTYGPYRYILVGYNNLILPNINRFFFKKNGLAFFGVLTWHDVNINNASYFISMVFDQNGGSECFVFYDRRTVLLFYSFSNLLLCTV